MHKDADSYSKTPLGLRVYTSRLLGASSELVLHGGGNTSVKDEFQDLLGDTHQALFVKGSGWDLATIEEAGFSPVKYEVLLTMAQLEELSDKDMVSAQRAALLEPSAPNPSVEAILHAIIPYKFVDHTHADAVVTLCNSVEGEQLIQATYPDLLVIPYVMPGFELAKEVRDRTAGIDWTQYGGMILMNHGVFTFADDARESYEAMIEIVTRAEKQIPKRKTTSERLGKISSDDITKIRQLVSEAAGKPQIVKYSRDGVDYEFSKHRELSRISQQGPLTPDHVIRTKITPALIDVNDCEASIEQFVVHYKEYFERHKNASHIMLNSAPKWAVIPNNGILLFGSNARDVGIVGDIVSHTIEAILNAETLGGWVALSPKHIFDVEYWELEQAKLGQTKESKEFEGRVVLVTGASRGIGRACAHEFSTRGAQVVSLDVAEPDDDSNARAIHHINCDITQSGSIDEALDETINEYGGLDVFVNNAGIFPASIAIERMEQKVWDRTLEVNLTAAMSLMKQVIPILRRGWRPSIVVIGSKNVPAPGPGAAAYSVAKAGLNQLGRIAALELAKDGVRVNMIHPNGIFDTELWTEELLKERADAYGLSVDEYRRRNLLSKEVRSHDVALMACTMAGESFENTTGSQVAVDGGTVGVI